MQPPRSLVGADTPAVACFNPHPARRPDATLEIMDRVAPFLPG